MSTILSLAEPTRQPEPACLLGFDIEQNKQVYLSDSARTRHTAVSGVTGSGKSTTLISSFITDVDTHGHGGLYLTPSWDSIKKIVGLLSDAALSRTILLDPADTTFQLRLNLLSCPDISNIELVNKARNRLMHVFKRIWEIGPQTPQLENLLSICLYTLILNQLTLFELPYLLREQAFRQLAVTHIPQDYHFVRWFWQRDFATWSQRLQLERTDSTLNKVLQFLTNPLFSGMVGQGSSIDFFSLLKQKKILLVPLAEDEIGDSGVKLIGTMLVAQLLDASLKRKAIAESLRELYVAYIDEFSLFASSDFASALDRIREMQVGVTIAFQHMGQIDDPWLKGSIEQTGNKVTFAATVQDRGVFAPLYARQPPVEWRDEPTFALSQNIVERLISVKHSNEVIHDISATFLARLVFFSEQLEQDQMYENAGYNATRFQLKQGRFLLDKLLLDVASKRLSIPSEALIKRICEVVLCLRGFIGFSSSARFAAKYRLAHQFVEKRHDVEYLYGLEWYLARREGTGEYEIRTHKLPTGEDEIEDIPLSPKAQESVTLYLQRLLSDKPGSDQLTLSIAQAKRLGIATPLAQRKVEDALLAEQAARVVRDQARARAQVAKEREQYVPKPKKFYIIDHLPNPESNEGIFWQDTKQAAKLVALYQQYAKDPVLMDYLKDYRASRFLRVIGLEPNVSGDPTSQNELMLSDSQLRARIKDLTDKLSSQKAWIEKFIADYHRFSVPKCLVYVKTFFSDPSELDRRSQNFNDRLVGSENYLRELSKNISRFQAELKRRSVLRDYLSTHDESHLVRGALIAAALKHAQYGWPDSRHAEIKEPRIKGKSTETVRKTVCDLVFLLRNRRPTIPLSWDYVQRLKDLTLAYQDKPGIASILVPYKRATFTPGFLQVKDTNGKLGELPKEESVLVQGYLLEQALRIVEGKGCDYYPSIQGVSPEAVSQTIVNLAAVFERAEQKRQVQKLLEAQPRPDLSGQLRRKFQETSVALKLDGQQYHAALLTILSDLGVTQTGLQRMRIFSFALKKLCELLSLEENVQVLKVISGYEKKAYRERTVADMVNEMEGELVSLEPFIAWSRIQDLKAPEGERIKKHKIKIFAPGEEMPSGALAERIVQIRQQSYDLCYTPREQVKKDIEARQRAFLNQPQEEDAPPPSQAPPDDEPPPTVAGE